MTTKYTVRKFKSFRGMEGYGFNAELVRDGKPVAFVIDDANGGEYRFEWYDHTAARVPVKGINFSGKPFEYQGTPEEAILAAHCASLPPTESPWTKGEFNNVTDDIFVEGIVSAHELAKRLEKVTKTKTIFKVDDKEYSINAPYTPAMKASLEAKYGSKLTILNTEFVSDDDAEALKRKAQEAKYRKQCKAATLFRLSNDVEGRYWVSKVPYSPAVKAQLQAKYGNKLVEIINETIAA